MRVPVRIHIHMRLLPQRLSDLSTRDNLMLTCEYVVAVYLKQWFRIKTCRKVTECPASAETKTYEKNYDYK